MSDEQIYIRFKGKTLGPLGPEKVHQLVKRGQVTRMHELSSDGVSWLRAEKFGEFFPQKQRNESLIPKAAKEDDAPAATISAAPDQKNQIPENGEWYVNIHAENRGPLSKSAVNGLIDEGLVTAESFVWRPGLNDWQVAELMFPDRFRRVPVNTHHAAGLAKSASSGASDPIPDLLSAPRGWVLFLSIFGIISSCLGLTWWVVFLIQPPPSGFEGSVKSIAGLSGILGQSITLAGSILLLRYGASLKPQKREDEFDKVAALRRLNTFWTYCGSVLLVTLIVGLGSWVIFLIVFTAAASSP